MSNTTRKQSTTKSNAKRAPLKSNTKKGEAMSLSAVVNAIATSTERDATKVGKALRSHVRSNFDNYVDRWPALGNKSNRDGNRYPDMPRDLADELIGRFTS